MSKINGQLIKIIKEKVTVITRAIFWKIPHDTKEDEIYLKIGRYKKPKGWIRTESPETLEPKSELTLDGEEFINLINFIQENYEPFKHGVKAFLPLDNPFEYENAEQIKKLLNLPEKDKILSFLLENDVIPEELEYGLLHARRCRAIDIFERMLEFDEKETTWQDWFQENSWVLGSDFVSVLDERSIDTSNISDFLMKSYDGFLDIVEIKRPEGNLKFWADFLDHGNYIPHSDLIKAITQASIYIYEVERESNSIKFIERVGTKAIKPRSVLIYGRSVDWNEKQKEAYRILNSGYYNLTIMTYDHVLDRARRIIGLNKENINYEEVEF